MIHAHFGKFGRVILPPLISEDLFVQRVYYHDDATSRHYPHYYLHYNNPKPGSLKSALEKLTKYCFSYLSPLRFVALKHFPAANETQNDNDNGNNEQDMNKPAHCV